MKDLIKIVALDLGSSTGVAYGMAACAPNLETWNLRAPSRGERAAILESKLSELLLSFNAERLYIEAPPNLAGMVARGTNIETLLSLYGYSFVAEMVGHKLDIPTSMIDVQVVRRHFLGLRPKAGEGKKLVKMRCHQLQWTPHNTNESDAAALWDYATALEDATVHIRTRLKQAVALSVV